MKIWGTQPKSIDDAEDRDKWYEILTKLDIKQPPGGMCTDEGSALSQSKKLGFPVMVRPSFVLGGRAMEIVYRYNHWKSLLAMLCWRVVIWPNVTVLVFTSAHTACRSLFGWKQLGHAMGWSYSYLI